METRPPEKGFSVSSFAAHSARGIIHDQKTRRRVMLMLIGAALLMLVSGSTFLRGFIEPHEYTGRFMLFWLACAWLTVSALLLAIFDVLIVRAEARAAARSVQNSAAHDARSPQSDKLSDG
ncbi:hypothetical protein BH18VER1_BH18VER1_13140 [soil metagenome]